MVEILCFTRCRAEIAFKLLTIRINIGFERFKITLRGSTVAAKTAPAKGQNISVQLAVTVKAFSLFGEMHIPPRETLVSIFCELNSPPRARFKSISGYRSL